MSIPSNLPVERHLPATQLAVGFHATALMIAALCLAAITLLSAGTARAASDGLLSGLQAQSRGPAAESLERPAETLPQPRKPRPFRQVVQGNCELPDPNANGICRFGFSAVPADRLLELQNISCFAPGTGGGVILSTTGKFSKLVDSLVAVIPAINDTATATNGTGPYFFDAGEQYYIWTNGTPQDATVCMVAGWLSRTD